MFSKVTKKTDYKNSIIIEAMTALWNALIDSRAILQHDYCPILQVSPKTKLLALVLVDRKCCNTPPNCFHLNVCQMENIYPDFFFMRKVASLITSNVQFIWQKYRQRLRDIHLITYTSNNGMNRKCHICMNKFPKDSTRPFGCAPVKREKQTGITCYPTIVPFYRFSIITKAG